MYKIHFAKWLTSFRDTFMTQVNIVPRNNRDSFENSFQTLAVVLQKRVTCCAIFNGEEKVYISYNSKEMKRGRPNMTRRNENFVSAVDFFNQLLRFYSEPEDQRENRIDQLIQLINENNDNASERVEGGIRYFINHA